MYSYMYGVKELLLYGDENKYDSNKIVEEWNVYC